MRITGNKGLALSLDAALAVMLMLILFGLILESFNSSVNRTADAMEQEQLMRTAVAVSEIIIKTSDKNTTRLGSALFLGEEKRVQENHLEYGKLKQKQFRIFNEEAGAAIAEIRLVYLDGGNEVIFSIPDTGKGCVVAERFVVVHRLLQNEKARLGVKVCHA